MYDHKVHSVADRIVSVSQPWLRPIVRGKATDPVEFGAKFDLSLDTEGYGRIEKARFFLNFGYDSTAIKPSDKCSDGLIYIRSIRVKSLILRPLKNVGFLEIKRLLASENEFSSFQAAC